MVTSRHMLKALSEINLADLDNPRAILAGGVVVDLGAVIDFYNKAAGNLPQPRQTGADLLAHNRGGLADCGGLFRERPTQVLGPLPRLR